MYKASLGDGNSAFSIRKNDPLLEKRRHFPGSASALEKETSGGKLQYNVSQESRGKRTLKCIRAPIYDKKGILAWFQYREFAVLKEKSGEKSANREITLYPPKIVRIFMGEDDPSPTGNQNGPLQTYPRYSLPDLGKSCQFWLGKFFLWVFRQSELIEEETPFWAKVWRLYSFLANPDELVMNQHKKETSFVRFTQSLFKKKAFRNNFELWRNKFYWRIVEEFADDEKRKRQIQYWWDLFNWSFISPVSYTHLTLPTIYSV
eukprot:TRINITY_DN11898_c0_g1_i1.p1 TRINITY_DN11898_c0_g1~~TRINITY_DN11898_c0_g1_i1.p1  ORF type:complete len:261 (+),score=43.47 TRINITY_DN11898_c0_g1_i1:47-829(+)